MSEQGTQMCILTCEHVVIFKVAPPQNGELIWCPRCRDYRVVSEGRAEFIVRCKHCRMSRRYGAARVNAELAATKHHQKNPSHVVELRKGSQVLHQFGTATETLRLDHALEVPPF